MISTITAALGLGFHELMGVAGVALLGLAVALPALGVAGILFGLPPGVCKALQGPVAAVGFLLAVCGFHGVWLARHDAGLKTAWEADQAREIAAAVEKARVAGVAAVAVAADEARTEALRNAPVREVIRHVPVQMVCSSNPGVASAMRSLSVQPGAGSGPTAPAARVP